MISLLLTLFPLILYIRIIFEKYISLLNAIIGFLLSTRKNWNYILIGSFTIWSPLSTLASSLTTSPYSLSHSVLLVSIYVNYACWALTICMSKEYAVYFGKLVGYTVEQQRTDYILNVVIPPFSKRMRQQRRLLYQGKFPWKRWGVKRVGNGI